MAHFSLIQNISASRHSCQSLPLPNLTKKTCPIKEEWSQCLWKTFKLPKMKNFTVREHAPGIPVYDPCCMHKQCSHLCSIMEKQLRLWYLKQIPPYHLRSVPTPCFTLALLTSTCTSLPIPHVWDLLGWIPCVVFFDSILLKQWHWRTVELSCLCS